MGPVRPSSFCRRIRYMVKATVTVIVLPLARSARATPRPGLDPVRLVSDLAIPGLGQEQGLWKRIKEPQAPLTENEKAEEGRQLVYWREPER